MTVSIPMKPPGFQQLFHIMHSWTRDHPLSMLLLPDHSSAQNSPVPFILPQHSEPTFSPSPSRLSYKQAPPCLSHCNLDNPQHVLTHCSQTDAFWAHKHTKFVDSLDLIPLLILFPLFGILFHLLPLWLKSNHPPKSNSLMKTFLITSCPSALP